MNRFAVAYLLLAISSTGALDAQKGTFVPFGRSCPTISTTCFSSNPKGGKLTTRQVFSGNLFAFPFTPKAKTVLVGCAFSMQAITKPRTVGVYVFAADAFGKPMAYVAGSGTVVGALRESILSLATTPGWYRAAFTPLVLQPNRRYFVAYISNSNAFMMPIVTPGTKSTHYFLPRGSRIWRGPFQTQSWAWKVLCAPPGVPVLSSRGSPALGKSFSVDLTNGPARVPIFLGVGASNRGFGSYRLPLDLGVFGAPSCSLLVSLDASVNLHSDASGSATASLRIPWQRQLLGKSFHVQWIASAPVANSLGLVFSNAGTGVIGS